MQIADQMAFLFTADDELEIDPASWEKLAAGRAGAPRSSTRSIAFVETCEWTRRDRSAAAIEALGVKPGKVMHVLYTAIEGRSQGLPLFDSIGLLGRESALHGCAPHAPGL